MVYGADTDKMKESMSRISAAKKKKKSGAQTAISTGSGAIKGAAAGSPFGPPGMFVGGLIGAAEGYLSGKEGIVEAGEAVMTGKKDKLALRKAKAEALKEEQLLKNSKLIPPSSSGPSN